MTALSAYSFSTRPRHQSRGDLDAFIAEVRTRANGQYRTPQNNRLFAVPLTLERARVWSLQNALWTLNRRDCWAFAQAHAPMGVKKLIWEHEEDELQGNKARGVENHFALQVRQSETIGMTEADFRDAKMSPGLMTCAYAWVHLVKDSHWLKSVAACAALEVSNSSDWVEGGGMSYRRGMRFEKDLGIPFHKQVNAKEHTEVDIEHAHMLIRIAREYAPTEAELDIMMEGVVETWAIETVWKGQLAELMEALPGPS
jgi:hypothetical protein